MRTRLVVALALLLGLWPVLPFLVRGFLADDDGLRGLLPLGLVLIVAWRSRGEAASREREAGLIGVLLLLVAYMASWPLLPLSLTATFGLLALWWGSLGRMMTPGGRFATASLVLFILPISRELDFYAGFPLRLLATRMAAILLWPVTGQVECRGTMLVLFGRMIEVDAPCSGIRMLWAGLVVVLAVASLRRFGPARTLVALLGGVLILVLANALRSAILALAEARAQAFSVGAHQVLGLMIFVGATLVILFATARWRNDR